jgi:hypothetical protein
MLLSITLFTRVRRLQGFSKECIIEVAKNGEDKQKAWKKKVSIINGHSRCCGTTFKDRDLRQRRFLHTSPATLRDRHGDGVASAHSKDSWLPLLHDHQRNSEGGPTILQRKHGKQPSMEKGARGQDGCGS